MTAVGKILVFFTLIFSLIDGAFVVVVYISQTHWAAENNDLKKRYEVADASNAAYQTELKKASDYAKSFNDQVLRDGDLEKAANLKADDDQPTKLKKIKDVIKATLADADVQKGLAAKARQDWSDAMQKLTASDAVVTAKNAEVEKRQEESKMTRELLAAETKKNLEAVVALGKEHDDAVAQHILAASAQARMTQLAEENDRLAKDNQKLMAGGAGTAPVSAPRTDRAVPPTVNVQGRIREVDPSGLVRISLGSDAGLVKGNTLEVYRLNTQAPDLSKYLGRIKIIQVTATEAVAEPVRKTAGPLQIGDQVSSKILGG
jgi:hypothetical protein